MKIDLEKLVNKFQENKEPLEFEVLYFFILSLEFDLNISRERLLSEMNDALLEWDCRLIKKEEVLLKE